MSRVSPAIKRCGAPSPPPNSLEQSRPAVKAPRRRVGQATGLLQDVARAVESLAVATADMTRAEAAIKEGRKGMLVAEKTLEYHLARLSDGH